MFLTVSEIFSRSEADFRTFVVKIIALSRFFRKNFWRNQTSRKIKNENTPFRFAKYSNLFYIARENRSLKSDRRALRSADGVKHLPFPVKHSSLEVKRLSHEVKHAPHGVKRPTLEVKHLPLALKQLKRALAHLPH